MTEQDLRKLGRRELMDLLLAKEAETDTTHNSYEQIESGLQEKLSQSEELNVQLQDRIDELEDQVELLQDQDVRLRDQIASLLDLNKELEQKLSEASAEAERLGRENQELQEQADQFESRSGFDEEAMINISEAGSIADAALKINHVFEDAQKAAQQYLDNIRQLSERQDAICARREQDSKEKAIRLLQKTEERCREKVAQTRNKCNTMEENAKINSDAYWAKVEKQMKIFVSSHDELKGLMSGLEGGIEKAKKASEEA